MEDDGIFALPLGGLTSHAGPSVKVPFVYWGLTSRSFTDGMLGAPYSRNCQLLLPPGSDVSEGREIMRLRSTRCLRALQKERSPSARSSSGNRHAAPSGAVFSLGRYHVECIVSSRMLRRLG